MNTPTKAYTVDFNADGISTTAAFDCSLAPIAEDFRGNLPEAVVTPVVTFSQPVVGLSSPFPGVTAQLVGTTVTFTFPNAPPQFDDNEVLIVYTAQFSLQFGL